MVYNIIIVTVFVMLAVTLFILGWHAWTRPRWKFDKVFSVVFCILGIEIIVTVTYIMLTGQL